MDYLAHLSKDRRLKKLIQQQQEPFRISKRKDVHFYLIASIMSQQLNTKVAHTIRNRFLKLYDGRNPKPEEVLATPLETLRSIGLSNAKAKYVQNVARFAAGHGLGHTTLKKKGAEATIENLQKDRGLGR